MANEFGKDDELNTPDEAGDDFGALTGGSGGLGNLPPLSDFDSGDIGGSDSDLPPLSDFDSGGRSGGLSPMGNTPLDTPNLLTPTEIPGRPSLGGFSDMDTPSRGLMDTPDAPDAGFAFQDLAADSDFSPETPEIGPGPDSDVDTPMFDSAFGSDSGTFPVGRSTGAPTQAMETPMFEPSPTPSSGFGFDKDAFGASTFGNSTGGGSSGGFDAGTPIPDFSRDTEMPSQGGVTAVPGMGGGRKVRRGVSPLVTAIVAIVLLIAGYGGRPYLDKYTTFLPNADRARADKAESEQKRLQDQMTILLANPKGAQISPEEIDALIKQRDELNAELTNLQTQKDELAAQVAKLEDTISLVDKDIEQKNQEYVEAQDAFDELESRTAITKARHEGLLAENERLTVAVGGLEAADIRRGATQDALIHNIDLIVIQIEAGAPLAPARYSRESRLAAAKALREKASAAKWVDPELLGEYTALIRKELDIAASREYFFARIPVRDVLGTEELMWAECLMNGNWSVYFVTLDGLHTGVFENVSGNSLQPEFEFRETLADNVRLEVQAEVTAKRPENFEEKILVLQGKQAVRETKTDLQAKFDSL